MGVRRHRARRAAIITAAAALALPTAAAPQTACPRATLPAYAHNDYANPRPLADALALGYRGVEADVFLVDGVLRLGHGRRHARTGDAFEARYLAPLDSVLARCGTLTEAERPFLLSVELKEASHATHDSLVAALARHPRVTTNVEVVLVGWRPPSTTLGAQYRIHRAGPIPDATLGPEVRLLSVDYGKTIGRWWVRDEERRRWLAAIRATKGAHPTRRLRVHNVPVNAAVYRALLDAGVDLVGTKDLPATARLLTPNTLP